MKKRRKKQSKFPTQYLHKSTTNSQLFFQLSSFESLESLPKSLFPPLPLQISPHFSQTQPLCSPPAAVMAFRKVLDKFGMKAEPKDLDNSSTSSAGESKKKMKKVKSIRIAPKKTILFQPSYRETEQPTNFMKSTTKYSTKKDTKTTTTTTTQVTTITSHTNYTAKNTKASRATVEEHNQNDCKYPYCSLHGHKHDAVPSSLKRFLSTKMQHSMKQRGYSSVERRGGKEIEVVEDVVNELFIEIQTKLQEQGIQIEEVENSSVDECEDNNKELSVEEIQVINQFLEYIDKEYHEEEEDVNKSKFGSDYGFNMSKIKRSRSRRQSIKNRECVKELNPRPPRLLEPAPEPEKERVNLRHQTVNEKKAAEEWMVDFALKKTLGRLTSVRRTKVPALVAAFENVMPQKV